MLSSPLSSHFGSKGHKCTGDIKDDQLYDVLPLSTDCQHSGAFL